MASGPGAQTGRPALASGGSHPAGDR